MFFNPNSTKLVVSIHKFFFNKNITKTSFASQDFTEFCPKVLQNFGFSVTIVAVCFKLALTAIWNVEVYLYSLERYKLDIPV